MPERLVIVGAGQAAAQAIQTLRQNGFDGRITLVGDEPFLPYQRPPLSKKYLAGALPRERLYLKPEDFYASRDVELVLGTRADAIHPDEGRVDLAGGRHLEFDRLLLATGSRVRRLDAPGASLPGVHYLRTIEDVDAIGDALAPGARLTIVGAGYIGLEVAAVAVGRGVDVTVLEAAPRAMARVVCAEVSDFYERYHRDAGVRIHCNAVVDAFIGDERMQAVQTVAGERYECDLAIVGIGIMPNVELAAQAGLAASNGIAVDECARTADPRVLAAGDCTSHPHPSVDRPVRLESVHNAVEQGKAAAYSILGQPTGFTGVPWFWSDQYDLKLQIAGLALDYDETVVRGDPDTASFAAFYLSAGRIVAVDAVNSPRDFMNAKKLIAAGSRIPPAEIRDTDRDLSSYA